ncbi:DUF2489 domain-containing protein [Marinospirillum sp. MEB164]|uniref:DUF2489 domain-containing protein n=1 Tax=Marinospirillum alkalitolerans TaxID=3123374 RepID=A0ABW8PX71_9GAMM
MSIKDAAILLAVAIAFLIPFAGYALHVHLEAKRRQALAEATHRREAEQASHNLYEQILLICRAAEDQQMDQIEACLRLRVMLDLLQEGRYVQQPEWQVIDQIYQRARHLATHQAYLDLAPDEKAQQDQQRRALEEQYEAQLQPAFQALKQFCVTQGGQIAPPLYIDAAAR